MDLSADNLSHQGHIPRIWDKGYCFRLMEKDVYWKQDRGIRVLHWWSNNFYLTKIEEQYVMYEEYEKVKRYETERWTPQVSRFPICYLRVEK